MKTADRPTFMESTPAARALDISVSRLHQLAERLHPPILRTTSGRRLFYAEDLERIRELRRAQHERALRHESPDVAA